jgi:hypothetical protein
MDVSTGVAQSAPAPPTLNTTFTGQNTIYVNNLNERKSFDIKVYSSFSLFSIFLRCKNP